MLVGEHVEALRREGGLMVEAIAGADPDATVPTCPEWTVRELAQHMGRIHRWATAFVRDARPAELTEDEEPHVWGTMPDDAHLVGWLRDGVDSLVEVLAGADESLQCWSFLPAPSPLAFWARRQAHETTIHRVDAESVTGKLSDVDRSFAADGVDELLCGFFSRGRRLRADPARALGVTATDTGDAWLLRLTPEGPRGERVAGTADGWVAAPAQTLYYGLWNRVPLVGAGVSRGGDESLLDLWRERATVRWS